MTTTPPRSGTNVNCTDGPSRDEIDAFIASPEWIDIRVVIRGQLVTGTGLGSNEVAPLAGFS